MVDLTQFVDLRDRRVNRPWSVGEWSIATDGAVAVAVPRLNHIAENDAAPDILGRVLVDTTAWQRPPTVDLPNVSGLLDLGCSVEFAFGVFARRNIRAIWSLDRIMIATRADHQGGMAFSFGDGGRGLVLPLTEPYCNNIIVRESVAKAA